LKNAEKQKIRIDAKRRKKKLLLNFLFALFAPIVFFTF